MFPVSLVKRGRTAKIVMLFSADSTSVSSPKGLKAAKTDSITSKSCQVGIKCDAFLSLAKTILYSFLLLIYPLKHGK